MPNINKRIDTIIMANGAYPEHEIPISLLKNCKYLVACDGAANNLISRNIIPSAIVGDCDSLSIVVKEKYANIIHRYKDQETNDLTKSVNFCLAKGITKFTILGATGKRDDHMIANISLLDEYSNYAEVDMISDYGCFNAIKKDSIFESFQGQQVSLFCLDYLPISSKNLRYPISDKIFNRWWQASLNESMNDTFEVMPTGSTIVYRVF